MRIAFVSDIHGNLAALDAVMADMAQRAVDAAVNLGDALSGPLLPLETAQRLSALPWLHVAGNHERQVLRLPLARQNTSDAYTSGQLADENKAWLASHEDPCTTRLHSGSNWALTWLCAAAARAATLNTCWKPLWVKTCGWQRWRWRCSWPHWARC